MLKMAGQNPAAQQEEMKEYITNSGLEVSGLVVRFGDKDVLLKWDAQRNRFTTAETIDFDWR